MSILATMRQAIATSQPVARGEVVRPPWWSALSSIGWGGDVLGLVATVQSRHGAGVLGTSFPNVLVVLKAGPGHSHARQAIVVLRQLAEGSTPTAEAGGTREGAARAAGVPTNSPEATWADLATYDEAAALRANVERLVGESYIGHYGVVVLTAFWRAWRGKGIKAIRRAYADLIERWVVCEVQWRTMDEREKREAERGEVRIRYQPVLAHIVSKKWWESN